MASKKSDNKTLSITYTTTNFLQHIEFQGILLLSNIWEIKSFDRLKSDIYPESQGPSLSQCLQL